jgi:hypothetical protein
MAVEDIGVEDIKRVVAPFWDQNKHTSARKLLNRIEQVIEYALAHGWRTADNPASWKRFQYIAPSLPKNGKKHHAAIGWRDMPGPQAMIRIAITVQAYDAIVATTSLGSVGYERERTERGRFTSGWRNAAHTCDPQHAIQGMTARRASGSPTTM